MKECVLVQRMLKHMKLRHFSYAVARNVSFSLKLAKCLFKICWVGMPNGAISLIGPANNILMQCSSGLVFHFYFQMWKTLFSVSHFSFQLLIASTENVVITNIASLPIQMQSMTMFMAMWSRTLTSGTLQLWPDSMSLSTLFTNMLLYAVRLLFIR